MSLVSSMVAEVFPEAWLFQRLGSVSRRKTCIVIVPIYMSFLVEALARPIMDW